MFMARIFTNGCFDILHRGHVELLSYCKSLGYVTVGLNSDSSVRRLKGNNRPVNKESDRKIILESLWVVDEVIIFDEDTPHNLIKKLKPDVIVKGGDYSPDEVVGKDLCEVKIFEFVKGYSTTDLIKKVKVAESDVFDSNPDFSSESHFISEKGWGYEKWIVNNSKYCGKILNFKSGKRCSFHFHKIKTETFYLQSGRVRVYFSQDDDLKNARKVELIPGQSFHVPVGLRHQIHALEDSEVFEFSTQHFESDSYRLVRGD